MYVADQWQDYEVLDCGDGEKLERWGKYVLCRPDPQVVWPQADPDAWSATQARYLRSDRGGGNWQFMEKLPERWQLSYRGLRFLVHPTGFKHTGLFPEQAANWDWMRNLIAKSGRNIRVLNLFAYTGGATIACAAQGAHVTHVDAAKGMVQWAKENRALNNIPETSCRYIVEDALSFVRRELRRGNHYDGILMDPPSYGRGPNGEVWKLENELFSLVDTCAQALSDQPLFFLVNGYTTGFQPSVLENIINRTVTKRCGGKAFADELVLPIRSGGVLPCGTSGRWQIF